MKTTKGLRKSRKVTKLVAADLDLAKRCWEELRLEKGDHLQQIRKP
jgi:hypothetical protein